MLRYMQPAQKLGRQKRPMQQSSLQAQSVNCEASLHTDRTKLGNMLTEGRTSACLTEDTARELTLDSCSSIAALLQSGIADMSIDSWTEASPCKMPSAATYLRNKEEDTTAMFVSCCVVSGLRVTALWKMSSCNRSGSVALFHAQVCRTIRSLLLQIRACLQLEQFGYPR